ncbi:MAG: TolC family protein [Alphaproteobacteria bacterium]|nr:TolC family protein [Alphaproteobacteria bacterium]
MHELFLDLSKRHKRIQAAESDMEAARNNVRVILGAWFPELGITSHYGYEDQTKPDATGTHMATSELDLKLSQLLWDFGATNSAVQQARLTFEQTRETLVLTRQGLLLEAVAAYLGLINAKEILDFALQSEANIKSQTEMENALVDRGSGFSTDVLQAKAQLAGANARRVQAQGALRAAKNRYRAVFYVAPPDVATLIKPRVPDELLPASVDEAVDMAMKNNPQLKVAKFSADVAKEAITQTRATQYFPAINGTVDRKWKESVQGTAGFKGETLVKAELTYSFNLGNTSSNAMDAARSTWQASEDRYTDTRELIAEQARNAWSNIETARDNAIFLGNQANISAEFLDLARKERQLGRRRAKGSFDPVGVSPMAKKPTRVSILSASATAMLSGAAGQSSDGPAGA